MEKIKLICFPHAGAGKLYYKKWEKLFSDEIDFCIIQYPMREQKSNVKMPDSIYDLAKEIFSEYHDCFIGNYAIWGHSMGSLVSYEVVKLCQKHLNNAPLAFFSSAAPAPCDESKTIGVDMDSREGFAFLLKKYGGLDEELINNDDFKEYFLPIIKADMKLFSNYLDCVIEIIKCPLILFEGLEDDCATDNWNLYSNVDVEVNLFSGGHFFIENHKDEIVGIIENSLIEY